MSNWLIIIYLHLKSVPNIHAIVSELKKKIKTAKDNLTEFSNNILGESSFNLNDLEKVDNATVRKAKYFDEMCSQIKDKI